VERGNRTYETQRLKFKKEAELDGKTFDEFLFLESHTHDENRMPNALYKISPFVLFRGRAPSTSTDGQELSHEQLSVMHERCAAAQITNAKKVYDRASKKCMQPLETFAVGDVVLVAAMEQQMRKKEAIGGRWGATARVVYINPLSQHFYKLRWISRGHLTKDKAGTVSTRYIFGLQLTHAPSRYVRDAEAADAKATAEAEEKKRQEADDISENATGTTHTYRM
jgi:hypothetical protein